jgi:hypothetical protein
MATELCLKYKFRVYLYRGCAVVSEPLSLPGIPTHVHKYEVPIAASYPVSALATGVPIALDGSRGSSSGMPIWVTNDRKVNLSGQKPWGLLAVDLDRLQYTNIA